jgi:hypothetical protein
MFGHDRFEAQAREGKERPTMIRQVLVRNDPAAEVPPTPGQECAPG